VTESGVIEHNVMKLGKVKCIPRNISTVNHKSAQIYDGVVIQDIFGKYSVLIPYEQGKCLRVKIPELEGCRVLDAKRLGRWLFVVYEKSGKSDCLTIYFDKKFESYQSKVDEHVDFKSINVILKDTNMIVFNKNDNDLELFFDLSRTKKIENTPVNSDMELYNGKATSFVNGKAVYELQMR
jgi:hypothetical protein